MIVLNPAEATLPFYPSHTELVSIPFCGCEAEHQTVESRMLMLMIGK